MRLFSILIALLVLLTGCAVQPQNNNQQTAESTETQNNNAIVTFSNSSSYAAIVYRETFDGVVIAELDLGEAKTIEVIASDNHSIGTTFPIKFKTSVFSNLSCGTVYADGIDPNMQLNRNLEAQKSYIITIPKPKNLVFETAFMKIVNASENYFELGKLGLSYKQTGSGALTVEAGGFGVYEIQEASKDGKLFENYKLRTVFTEVDFPSFTAYYSHVYTFVFNGTTITQSGDYTLIY